MNYQYHRWWSVNLGQEMEMSVYGAGGKPILVFPAQGGSFHEFEDFGMVEACRSAVESGKIKLFTVTSLDNQSWANYGISPGERAARHNDYDRYIVEEVVTMIEDQCPGQGILTTGCSMGAYHAGNFFFRHPDIFDSFIALSGLFSLKMFIGDYMDDNVYMNTPLFMVKDMADQWFIDNYRRGAIIYCVGQGAWEEPMLEDAFAMSKVLSDKGIPHWFDLWGYDVNHDWPWWRKMLPYFLGSMGLW